LCLPDERFDRELIGDEARDLPVGELRAPVVVEEVEPRFPTAPRPSQDLGVGRCLLLFEVVIVT
jgi:hypothetical protein